MDSELNTCARMRMRLVLCFFLSVCACVLSSARSRFVLCVFSLQPSPSLSQEQLIADLLEELKIVKGKLARAEQENVSDRVGWLRMPQ